MTSSAWQPDLVAATGSPVQMVCSKTQDPRRPAPLFRSGNRDHLDAGPGVSLAALPGRRLVGIGAAIDGLSARRPRSHHAEPSGARMAICREAARNQAPPAGPLHALVDSTGLQVYGAGQWVEEKHGARSRRGWRKLHLALDADSGEIVADTLTDQDAGGVSQVAPLLYQIFGPIGQFKADGAYDGKPTYDAVIDHSAAAAIVIPPRANAVERSEDRPPGQRNRHIAAINSDAG